jgi:hypothetical protein
MGTRGQTQGPGSVPGRQGGANGRPAGPSASELGGATASDVTSKVGALSLSGKMEAESKAKGAGANMGDEVRTQGDYLRQRRMLAAHELASGHSAKDSTLPKDGRGAGAGALVRQGQTQGQGLASRGAAATGKDEGRFGKFLSTWSK